MGFPAKTSTGEIVEIVHKEDGDAALALLTDSEGNKYTANGQVLTLVEDAPEAGDEPASEPESDEEVEETFDPVSTDDDPLGNPFEEDEEEDSSESDDDDDF